MGEPEQMFEQMLQSAHDDATVCTTPRLIRSYISSELAECRRERDGLLESMGEHSIGYSLMEQVAEAQERAESAESRLAAIRAVQVPEEPTYWIVDFERGIVRHAWNAEFGDYVTRDDYKAIRAFAEAVQAKAGES